MYERGARLTFLQHFLAIIANLALASLRDRSRPMFRLRGDRVGRGHCGVEWGFGMLRVSV
ncbi:hypothetical protein BDZ91DRAFT_732010, partial [Kalaharituber pfeilii]